MPVPFCCVLAFCCPVKLSKAVLWWLIALIGHAILPTAVLLKQTTHSCLTFALLATSASVQPGKTIGRWDYFYACGTDAMKKKKSLCIGAI
jgi:hypothetical protein